MRNFVIMAAFVAIMGGLFASVKNAGRNEMRQENTQLQIEMTRLQTENTKFKTEIKNLKQFGIEEDFSGQKITLYGYYELDFSTRKNGRISQVRVATGNPSDLVFEIKDHNHIAFAKVLTNPY